MPTKKTESYNEFQDRIFQEISDLEPDVDLVISKKDHNDPLLKPPSVAQMLGVSPRTLKDWRRRKCGPKWISIGKNTVRYHLSDVKKFIQQRR